MPRARGRNGSSAGISNARSSLFCGRAAGWERGGPVWRGSRRNLKRALVAFLRARGRLGARRAGVAGVLRALLAYLAASPARIIVVNLEDLWLERRPQNVPGTGLGRPNWRRKARYGFAFTRMKSVLAALGLVHRLRGQDRRARV